MYIYILIYCSLHSLLCYCVISPTFMNNEYLFKFCYHQSFGYLCYHFRWNGGKGSNNRAEVIALWGLLYCARRINLEVLHVFGDSQVTIDWINRETTFALPEMVH